MNDQEREADRQSSAADQEADVGRSGSDAPDAGRVTLTSMVLSTLAAAVGVQSRRNRERDFTRGNAMSFIIAGVVFTVLFVFTIVTVVNLVLAGVD